ncbi:hypothetical protein BAE44_0007883, partial [Dichanthelium oligosanthes]
MEFFAGRGLADDEGGGSRFPEPPQHGDATMLVIRDALLSQLQKDCIRQEIIVAELAKIERAMALRSAGAQRADPAAPFTSKEHFTPHSGGAVGAEHDVAAGEVHGLQKKDRVVQQGVELKPGKPDVEELAGECFKTCCSTGKAARQENAALDGCKLQESTE